MIVRAIVGKELRELCSTWSMIVMGVVASLFFSLVLSGGGLEGSLFLTPLLVALALGYYGCSQVFLREKTDFVIETFLCSPATLRDLWLGKTLGVTLFAELFALGTVLLTVVFASLRAGSAVILGGVLVVHLVAVLPLVVACLVGARGYVQLLFGMRESQIISMGFLIALILLLRVLGASGETVLALPQVVAAGLAAAGFLVALGACSRFLSVERIVTSI